MNKLTKNITRVLLLSILIYFLAVWYVGWEDIVTALRKVDAEVILVPILLSLGAYILRFTRWQYFLHLFRKRVQASHSLLIYFSGFALAMTPGKVGELLRCAYLKPYKISYKRSSAMFVVERLLDVISMLCLSVLAVGYFTDKLNFLYLILGLVLVALVFLLNPRLILGQRRRVAGRDSRLMRAYRHILDMLIHTGRILKPLPLAGGLVIGILAWFLDGSGFYWITSHFVSDIGITSIIGIYALSILLGAFSFMPGGVGATEALMYGFLHLFGVEPQQAVVIIILSRLTTIWFAVLLGAVSVTLLGRVQAKQA
jgi:uncharacterized protein (TIRG00374 family)